MIFGAVKGANRVVAIRVMKRVAKRNNVDPVALVYYSFIPLGSVIKVRGF
jgi:hypothetical protein